MKLPLKYYFALLMLVTLGSCTIYRNVPIEVLQPKEISIPESSNLAILYRNFKYENDTLQNYFRDDYEIKKDIRNANLNIDSIVTLNTFQSLAFSLGDDHVGNNIQILPLNTLPRLTAEKLAPLPREVIQNLGSSSGSQKIIVLETLSYMYSHYSPQTHAGESAEVIMAGIWAVYDVLTGEVVKHESLVDTLYWNRTNEDGQRILIPPRITALELAAEVYAGNFAKKFTTSWETVQRLIIIPPVQEFTMAAEYASENKWEEALELWQRYSSERYGRLSASARFNVALAYEMLDDIDSALEWIDKALVQTRVYRNKEELKLVQNYQRILNQRKKEIDHLQNALDE
jgi:tetratricopeptide (TPR) repeat protein